MISRLLGSVKETLQRSATVLTPLIGLLAMMVEGALGAVWFRCTWLAVVFALFFGVVFFAVLTAYFVLLFRDPEALGSEKFILGKMAIKRGLVPVSLCQKPPQKLPTSKKKTPMPTETESGKFGVLPKEVPRLHARGL
jgi:hypothetical protein